MSIQRLPLSFRADLLPEIYRHLEAGKCGALVGVASSGKSRLVEFMGRSDVRQQYLGDDGPVTLFPWVDGNDLLEQSEWGLWEKVLQALLIELQSFPDGGTNLRAVTAWYDRLTEPANRVLARRFVHRAIADLQGVHRVVLLFDDLEKFLVVAEENCLSGLRAMRDAFKRDNQYRLLFLLFTRQQPVSLRQEMTPGFEAFMELFKNFILPIGCYGRDDALAMIQRLSEAYALQGRTITTDLADRLYQVTGGHAGLIDAAFHSKTEAAWQSGKLASVLISAGGVWNECSSIYESLEGCDQQALEAVVSGQDPRPEATGWLERCGLVQRDAHQQPRAIELLQLFVREERQAAPKIDWDDQHRRIQLDGVAVEFSEREYLLAKTLWQVRGNWRTEQQLAEVLYPGPAAPPGAPACLHDVREVMRRLMAKLRREGRHAIFWHDGDSRYKAL